MSEPELLVDVADHVGTLTINRPEKRNALSWDLIGGVLVAKSPTAIAPRARQLLRGMGPGG